MSPAEQRLEDARRAQTAARIAARKARSAVNEAGRRGSPALYARRVLELQAAREARLAADDEYLAADVALG